MSVETVVLPGDVTPEAVAEAAHVVETQTAIERELKRGDFIFRYVERDDFGEPETAFLACNFWYMDALHHIGRTAEAREMFERGVSEEVRSALEQPLSFTARRVMGLREVAELSPEQAIEAIALQTRRYAAYQRKWMRRVPALIKVNANRSTEEVADEIVEVARTGK